MVLSVLIALFTFFFIHLFGGGGECDE